MKVATAAVILWVALVTGALWLHNHDARVRETAAAVRSADSLLVAVARERRAAAATHTADSLAAAQQLTIRDNALRLARARADRMEAAWAALADSAHQTLPDSLEPLMSRVRAACDAALAAKDAALASADSALAVRDSRIVKLEADYSRDLAARDAQLAEATRQLGAALKRATPGLLTRIVDALPWVVGAGAGGYLLGRLTR